MDDKTTDNAQSAKDELKESLRSLSERGIHSPGLQRQLEQAIETVWEVELARTRTSEGASQPPDANVTERRAFPREEVGGPGTLIFGEDAQRLEITVVNISRTGIMLELSDMVELPLTFSLLFKNVVEPCDLVWQNGLFVGAKYSE